MKYNTQLKDGKLCLFERDTLIGEVSPDALSYVKEGDEFDEGDFQIVFRDEEGGMWNSPEASAWTGYTGEYKPVCLMRCPSSSKHFH